MIKKIIILAVSVFLMTACGEEAVKPEKQDIQQEETKNQEKTAELKEEINQATADLNKEEEAALALKQKEEEANALALKQAEEQKEEEANALALKQAEEQKQKEEAEAAALALKKRDEEAMKALAKKESIKKEKILFKAVFYPYFRNRGEVPYQLKVDLEKKIPEIISILKKNPKASLFVKGYTTTDGSNRFNQFLSLWRARETAEYLSWKSGISLKKIKVKGLGVNSGKEKRKVEIVISKKS
ncbi:MAG: hypothetical protein A2Y41_08605 [Spirochaetes bacterium GWB1_36_13]|nr:MAG: hypothetical protein A2Y41_08605 [Spirochaetes bacterium GWB1_36_13]